ncbi:MAG: tetratricopeptide repeat protein, partial [Pseudomonadota bacterium]
YAFVPMGEHKVKNIPEPVTVYRVEPDPGLVAKAIGWKGAGTTKSRWAVGVLAAAVLALLAAASVTDQFAPWRTILDDTGAMSAGLDPHRIAVLPFANMSQDEDNAYFADGITEELTTRIAQVGRLAVIARTSIMRYKNTEKSIGEIGRELSVGTILEGSVRKVGDQVRITAQLIDVDTEAHLWAKNYDQPLADVFGIQSAVAQEVAESLKITLLEGEQERIAKPLTNSVEAHSLYLRAMHVWDHTSDIVRAVELLEEAIDQDPSYAAAHAALSDLSLSLTNYTNISSEEAGARAAKHAEMALALDSELAEAHYAAARVKMAVDWDWDGAEKSFKRALELNPNLIRARIMYGWRIHLALRRNFDQALREVSGAYERDPLSIDAISAMAWVRYHRREYDAAIAMARQGLELFPDDPWLYACLGQSQVRKGDHDTGLAEIQRGLELAPDSGFILTVLGWSYGMSGQIDKAQEVFTQLEGRAEEDAVSPVILAWTLSGMNEKSRALDYLEQAYAQHDNMMIWLRNTDLFDILSEEPRYQALARKMGLEV